MIRTFALLFALAAASASAQTRHEETVKSANPADDTRELTPGMPDSVAISTNFERVVMIRFRNQADLLAGIERHVKEQNIKNAIILSGFGSLVSAHYHVVSNREFPSKNLFIEDPKASADIVNVSGAILNGKIHAHMTLAGPDNAYGGHIEPRSRVFTFAVITLGVLPHGIDMSRFDDKNWR